MNELKTANVLSEVLEEREAQEMKWGEQNHEVPQYLMILGEEVGEANKEALETYFANLKPREIGAKPASYASYRKELIQVAAVAVAMVECLDRNGK